MRERKPIKLVQSLKTSPIVSTLLVNEKPLKKKKKKVLGLWHIIGGNESGNGTWTFDLISRIPIWTTPIFIQAFPNWVGQALEIRTHQQFVIVSKIVNTCVAMIKNLGGKLVFRAEAEKLT
jgi:hypothetical protein